MTDMCMTAAEGYYACMKKKDIEGLGQYLHPDVQFIGPLAQLTGKAPVIEGAGRLMQLFTDLTIRAKCAAANQVMLAYDLHCHAPIGTLRVAALLTFTGTLISCIEIFF